MRALKGIEEHDAVTAKNYKSKKGGRRKTVNRIRQVRWEHIDKWGEKRQTREKKEPEAEKKKVRSRGIKPLTG